MSESPRNPTESLPQSSHEILRRFRLRVVDGPDKARTFVSEGERTIIGTDQGATFALTDATVSGFHCEVRVDATSTTVRDVGSTNGTFVNGVRVEHAYLEPNAIIALGRTRIRVEPREDTIALRLSDRESFGKMVGRSTAMRRVFALLEQVAESDSTVLLLGETGTGKEVAAEAIHSSSPRKDGPFIVVDCGAMPPNLMESELFGHERGAFTGADRARAGAFEAANGGTLFLDEIGELEQDLQPKLLRVLEKRQVKRVGSNKVIDVDVRVIAATNRDLRAEVNAKRFRADLYFRIAVLEVQLPALRHRLDDLPMLVEHIASTIRSADPAAFAILRTAAFLNAVRHQGWPGNVRELRNYVERCLMLEEAPISMGGGAPVSGTPAMIDLREPLYEARDRMIAAFERAYLVELLDAHQSNVSSAARAAKVDRVHFYRLLRRYGLRSE
jgi:DNA-binding NtrC family response regulator